MSGAAIASLTGAVKRYGPLTALAGLDLAVGPGEVLALLGPNGAGKTTAISLMLGLQRPDAGEARLFGLAPHRVEARRSVGVMMQDVSLPVNLTPREAIAQAASYYPAPMSVADAVALAGIGDFAGRRYGKLSGGQKRQAQFAMAICGRPRLMFLDEPTANLDEAARRNLWAVLRGLVGEGCSIVLTTHYIEEAEALADRVVVIDRGRSMASGTVADMRAAVVRKRVSGKLSRDVGDVRDWAGVDAVTRDGPALSFTAVDAEGAVRRLLAADPDLADLDVRRASLAEAVAAHTTETCP